MATKQDLLDTLTEAGVDGYTFSDSKTAIEEAVAKLVPAVNRQKGV